MLLLIAEIAMLLGGAYALFTGKMPQFFFGAKYVVEGTAARIIGFIFMIPLPTALVLGFLMGLLFGNDALVYGTIVELALVLACLIIGLVYGNRVKRLKEEVTPTMPSTPNP